MRNSTQQPDARRVLLIEGNPYVRTPLEQILQSRGYHVTALGSGEDGLIAIADGGYDVVVCNYHLPGMSGIDFFTRSRHILSGKTTIMTAAFTDNCLAKNALALGITVFMEMPFKIDNLVACIEGRTLDLLAGSLGHHLYITSGGQMIVISPTSSDGCAAPASPPEATLPKAINLAGRRWKLYLNPDAPAGDQRSTGTTHSKKNRRNKTDKPLYDLC